MMDLVEEVESYSPQTGQPNNSNQQPNYFQPNPYPSDPYHFNLQEPSQDSTESPPKPPKEKEEEEKESGCTRFFKKKFYEQFFRVSESQVVERVKATMIPPFNEEFVELIKPSPDFYGPFWTMATIVCLLGIVGNFANYIQSKFSDDTKWEGYFFRLELVRHGTIVVFAFGLGVPLLLYALFKVMKCNEMTLPEVVCLYGYSMFCYVPALLVCIVPFGVVQWLVLAYALANSSLFLYLSLKKHIPGSKQVVVLILLAVTQVTYFLLLRLLFFGPPEPKLVPAPAAQPDAPVQP